MRTWMVMLGEGSFIGMILFAFILNPDFVNSVVMICGPIFILGCLIFTIITIFKIDRAKKAQAFFDAAVERQINVGCGCASEDEVSKQLEYLLEDDGSCPECKEVRRLFNVLNDKGVEDLQFLFNMGQIKNLLQCLTEEQQERFFKICPQLIQEFPDYFQ